MQISIAGCRFTFVTENVQLEEHGKHHWVSNSFELTNSEYNIFNDVTVVITDRPAPSMEGFSRIFESESNWTCWKCGNDYMIIEQPPQYEEPILITLIRLNEQEIFIHCASEFIDKSSGLISLHPFYYPLDQVILTFLLADNQGGIIHSAGWRRDDGTLILAGKSGAGKSTIARLIKQVTKDPFLSDDRVAVRRSGEGFDAYGTPWAGEEMDALNDKSPLKGLLFLHQAEENKVETVSSFQALKLLMPVMTVPWYDKVRVGKMMDLSDILLQEVPVYLFSFTRDQRAVECLQNFNFK